MQMLLKAKDVQRMLGVSLAMVYHMAERGQLPCVRWKCPGEGTEKPRTALRFEPERIRLWIQEHRVDGNFSQQIRSTRSLRGQIFPCARAGRNHGRCRPRPLP